MTEIGNPDIDTAEYRDYLNLMTTTNNLKSEIVNGERWVECTCGAGEYLPKLLSHRRSCRTLAQWSDAPVAPVVQADSKALNEFAANVRRTGLAHGRTDDLVEAVRTGRLSVSDAMNTDD